MTNGDYCGVPSSWERGVPSSWERRYHCQNDFGNAVPRRSRRLEAIPEDPDDNADYKLHECSDVTASSLHCCISACMRDMFASPNAVE